MIPPLHVLGFSGSLRAASYNSAALRAAADLLPDGMSLDICSLIDLPLYNADVEATGTPEAVQTFRQRLAAADALLIACPEYNFSITGALKNALDWASRGKDSPLNGKPVAMLGAGGGFGTVRAQLHLRDVLLHNDMHPLNRPQVHISRAWEHFDEAGNLTNEKTREQIRALLVALAAWTRRLQEHERS